jgi:hypothetical protein
VAGRFSGKGLLLGAVAVAAVLAAASYLAGGTGRPLIAASFYVLAAFGGFAGASAFERGDRMRIAWISIGLANVFGAIPPLILLRPPLHVVPAASALSSVPYTIEIASDVLLNVLEVIGIVIFAQAWRSLGVRSRWYLVATGIAFAVGAATAGPALVDAVRHFELGGPHDQLTTVISSLGDLTSITMIGPLAVTAVAMRGGAFVWPFVFLTIGNLTWLLYDAGSLLSGNTQTIMDLACASLGSIMTGTAGLAHQRALKASA